MNPLRVLAGLATALLAAPASAATLEILTQTFPGATAGEPYIGSMDAAGGNRDAYVWDIQGLPAGLTVESGSRATVRGVPEEVGTFHPTVSVTDGTDRASVTAVLQVAYTRGLLQGESLDTLLQGQEYRKQLEASRATPPVSFALVDGELPAGLALDAEGLIAGVVDPAARVGEYGFTVEARDAVHHIGRADFSLRVQGPPPSLAGGLLGTVRRGEGFRQVLEPQGGKPPFAFGLVDGGLPEGLDLATDGTISGTVRTDARLGDHAFRVAVEDADRREGGGDFVIRVVAAKARAAKAGGGCSAGGSPGWLALLAAAALRRRGGRASAP